MEAVGERIEVGGVRVCWGIRVGASEEDAVSVGDFCKEALGRAGV